LNGTPARWDRIGLVGEYPGLKRIEYVAASFLVYGIGEEVGWRGFLYPALRRPGRRILTAALLVVPFWALWHLPLFLATESYRAMGLAARLAGCCHWRAEASSPPGSPTVRKDRCCRRPSFTPSWMFSSSPTSPSRFSPRWGRS
jgi:hypothetical protein